MRKSHTTIFFFISAICFFTFSLIIFSNHHNPGFWFQADHTWAPHFVYDLTVKHGNALDWQFATGTIHLFSTISFFIFSLFTHNMLAWIHYNAVFNLCLYFLCLFVLSCSLFDDLKSRALLMLGGLISLGIVASFQQIPFTLDMLLVSGEHLLQVIVSWFSLILTMRLLKKDAPKFPLIVLFLLVALGVVSDELLYLSFVGPALLTLGCYFFLSDTDSKTTLKVIFAVLIAAIVGRVLWTVNPLHYLRVGYLPMALQIYYIVESVLLFFNMLFKQHPVYLTANFLYFFISLPVIFLSLQSGGLRSPAPVSKRMQLFTLLFCTFTWIVGLGGLFINYHTLEFYAGSTNFLPISKFNFDAITRDSMAFLLTPVFIGIPTLLVYCLHRWLTWINVAAAAVAAFLAFMGIRLIPSKQVSALKSQQGIMQCLEKNIKKYDLHTGIANYWIYRPIVIMSNGQINMAPIYAGKRMVYEHYLSTWNDINNRKIDFWLYRYNVFFEDPVYTNYYKTQQGIQFKLKVFGKPTGQFICRDQDGSTMGVYVYKNGALTRAIVHSLHHDYKIKKVTIDSKQRIQLNLPRR